MRFIDAPADNLTALGVAGPWSQRLPHFRLDATPSNGDEIQSEYFVDRAARGRGPGGGAPPRRGRITPLLLVSEIRAVAADQLWLSGAYGRDTLAIHFTWRNRPAEVDAVVARGRGGARAVRRPPALGQGLPRHRPTRLAELLPPARRRAGPVRAARPRRPVQQRPPGAPRRPRWPRLTGRHQPAPASVLPIRSRTSPGSRSGGRWSMPGTSSELAPRYPVGGLPVRLHERRVVGVADHQRGGNRDLAQPAVHGRVLQLQVTGGQGRPARPSAAAPSPRAWPRPPPRPAA